MAAVTRNHDYHIVNPSPWPIVGSISLFILAVGAVLWMHEIAPPWVFAIGVIGVLYTMYGWWSDVIKEGHAAYPISYRWEVGHITLSAVPHAPCIRETAVQVGKCFQVAFRVPGRCAAKGLCFGR